MYIIILNINQYYIYMCNIHHQGYDAYRWTYQVTLVYLRNRSGSNLLYLTHAFHTFGSPRDDQHSLFKPIAGPIYAYLWSAYHLSRGGTSFIHIYDSCHVYDNIYAYYCIIIYLPIYLSTYLPIYLSTYLPIYLSTYLSIYLSIHVYVYVYVYVSHISGMGLIGSPPKHQVADETGFTMSEARQRVEMFRNSKLLPAKNMALTGKQVCFTGRSVVLPAIRYL